MLIRDPVTKELVGESKFKNNQNTDGINKIPTPGAGDKTPELTIEK